MPDQKEIKADFCLEIDFDKNSENPSRVFQAMTALIESFEKIDHDLAISIDSKIEPVLLLEDIEKGSLRAWFINKIKDMDDESLKTGDYKRLIGSYLVKAKYFIINNLEGKSKITDKAEIQEIQDGLLGFAKSTDVKYLPDYRPIDKTKLIAGIESITKALSYLNTKDNAYYISEQQKASFNITFQFVPQEIEDLLTEESTDSLMTMIVKVKKPDYLGSSMWEFHHGTAPLYAKIADGAWLKNFQNRKEDVRPGDSLKVRMRIINNYDYDHNLVSVKHFIEEVIEVLRPPDFEQLEAFGES